MILIDFYIQFLKYQHKQQNSIKQYEFCLFCKWKLGGRQRNSLRIYSEQKGCDYIFYINQKNRFKYPIQTYILEYQQMDSQLSIHLIEQFVLPNNIPQFYYSPSQNSNCQQISKLKYPRRKKMKIPLNDILEVYENIVKDINVAEVSIVIFTALDIDSLCTLKILSKFLKNDNILYKIYPTSTFTELQQKIEESKAFQKIRLFFFINCGGILDLTKKWFARTSQIFLFQINKPIHHANIQDPNIKIIDDAFSDLQKAPTSQQYEMIQNVDDDFVQELQQRQLERDRSEDDDQDQIVARKRRRNRSASQAIQRIQRIRKIRSQLTQKVQQYYSQQFYGLPSSYIAYRLIKDLQKLNNQYLWFAIVGTTSMYLQQKLQRQQFDPLNAQLRLDMSKCNKPQSQNGNSHQKNSLKKILDFQFPLLRHWSLYQSIMNSSYMISHLSLWDQFGVKKLYELLNLIGLSLDECKQLYKYMLKTSITKLQKQLLTHAQKQKFKIFDVAFQSCMKQVDYAFQMSASDYYYALSAILERSTKKLAMEQVLTHRIQCFWQAYSLFQANQAKLLSAIEESKKNLKTATKQAFSILQRNHIINGEHLTFVNIISDTQDRKIFEHPYALIKFAYLLMAINKQKKKHQTAKPFIISLQNNLTQTSEVVGIINQSKNSFPQKFNYAIEKFNIQANNDNFMSNFMIVPKEAVGKIIREMVQS